MTTPVIELGDLSDGPANDPERPAEFRHGTVRRLVLAGLAVLCVVALGASARPGRPQIRELWSMPFAQSDMASVVGDRVLLHRVFDERAELSVHDAATGTLHWNRQVGEELGGLETSKAAGVTLVPGDQRTALVDFPEGGQGLTRFGGTMTAVDTATGATLWQHPGGFSLASGPDTVLLAEIGESSSPERIRMVRAREGTVVWERAVPSGAGTNTQVQFEGTRPARVVVATGTGDITLLDFDTGTLLLERTLPWVEGSPETGDGSSLSTTSGLLLEIRNSGAAGGTGTATAYRIDTLERLWSLDAAGYVWVQDCGPLVCLTSESGYQTVDPWTGKPRWGSDGQPAHGMLPGDDVLLDSSRLRDSSTVLREAATGQVRGAPARGWLVSWDFSEGFALLRLPMPVEFTRSVLTWLDLRTGRSILLGTIGQGGDLRCSGAGRILACQGTDRLVVYRIA
ncbi:PQQ-binding-like beta-propeller repeat protein [Actinoplanes sp. G11-F43]|uniref:outer membrane protein assembly factor BamB family protein n=1 Tax=Actinoplanes sp. G11-F43 TaxID=3424130 RepID=UPI003D328181